jgi:hypothetical protein
MGEEKVKKDILVELAKDAIKKAKKSSTSAQSDPPPTPQPKKRE